MLPDDVRLLHMRMRRRVVHKIRETQSFGWRSASTVSVMESLDRHIRRRGLFLRRRDLLAHGYTDDDIRAALELGVIFRVRQGWYSVPDAPPAGVHAVRVGGRLTGISALESYGLRVPRRALVHVAVPINACRLRRAGRSTAQALRG